VLGDDSGAASEHLDLARWNGDTIDLNVQMLILIAALLTAVVLGMCAADRAVRTRRERGSASGAG